MVRLADVKSSGVWSDEDVIAIQALRLAKLSGNRIFTSSGGRNTSKYG